MRSHLVTLGPPLVDEGVVGVLVGKEVGGSDGAAIWVEELSVVTKDLLIEVIAGQLGHGIVKRQIHNL